MAVRHVQTAHPGSGSTPIWNWTESEQTDSHTRWCIVKGGSWYRPSGSMWYADGGTRVRVRRKIYPYLAWH